MGARTWADFTPYHPKPSIALRRVRPYTRGHSRTDGQDVTFRSLRITYWCQSLVKGS